MALITSPAGIRRRLATMRPGGGPAAERADRLAAAAFLVLAAALGAAGPLIGLANGGYDIDAVAPLAVGILIVAAGAVAIVPGAFPRSRPGLLGVVALAALAALTMASLAWSPNVDLGWLLGAKTVLYVGAFTLAAVLVRSAGAAAAALTGIAAGSAVLAAVTVARVVAADDPLPHFFANRLSGSVGYHNGLAATLLVGALVLLVGAAARVGTPAGIARRAACWAALGGVAVTALAAQSRGATLAALVAALVLLAISPARVRMMPPLVAVALACIASYGSVTDLNEAVDSGSAALIGPAVDDWALRVVLATVILAVAGVVHGLLELRLRRSWPARRWARRTAAAAAGLIAVVALAVAVVNAGTIADRVRDPIESIAGSDVPKSGGRLLSISSSGRVEVWSEALPALGDRPLVGQGTGGFSIWWNTHRDIGTTDTLLAHSVFLEHAAETGALGLTLLVAWLAAAAWAAGALWRRRRVRRELTAGLLAVPVLWVVAASFDWHWSLPSITLTTMVTAGALVGLVSAQRERWSPTHLMRPGVRVAIVAPVILLALAGAAAVAMPYAADRDVERAAAIGASDTEGARKALNRAERLNSHDPRLDELRARIFLYLGNLPRARDELVAGTRRNPEHYTPWLRLADFDEFVLNRPAAALPSLRRALKLHVLHGNGKLARRIKEAQKKARFQREAAQEARS